MSAQTLEVHGKSVSLPTGLFIGGEFRKALAGKTFPVESPATGKEIIQVQEGMPEDVDEAVKVARKTFKSKEYAEFGAANRAKCMHKLADLMEEHFEELVLLEMFDTGKTRHQAANLDIPGSIGTLRYYAGWADKVMGQSNIDIPGVFGYTRREPVGVCGQIIVRLFRHMSSFTLTLHSHGTFRCSCSHGRSLRLSRAVMLWLSNRRRPHHSTH